MTAWRVSLQKKHWPEREANIITTVLYILLAVVIFGFMIFIHELGHFLTARACGVGVNEFAIGMGPKLISRVSKKSGIRYSLRLLPIGGFVSMVGEDEESTASNAFGNVKPWRRMIIIVAGAFMNLLLGVLIMLIIVTSTSGLLATNVIGGFDDGAVSNQQLMVNDKIIKVGHTRVFTGYDCYYEIMNSGYEAIDLTVIRDGERVVLEDVVFNTFTESGATFGEVDFTPYGEQKTLPRVLKHTWVRSVSTVRMVWDSLVDMVRGRYGMDAISGPVGITGAIGDAAKTGVANLLYLCAVIAINLGVVNLLPLPALDGGRFVFILIEAVRGKPIKKEVEAYIHFVGIIILFAFMLVISCKDIWMLFK